MSAVEALLLTGLGLGVWLIVQRTPSPVAPPLSDRVTPYLGRPDSTWESASATGSGPQWIPRWMLSGAERASGRMAWITGGDGSVQRRLDALGPGRSVEQFRLEQIGWGAGSTVAAGLFLLARSGTGEHWVPGLLAMGLAAAAGVLARDHALSRSVRRRTERMRAELPTIIEMLAMAVGAGSSLSAALERVSRVGRGVVAAEITRVLDDTRVGLPLVPALQRLASRNELNEVNRFVDALVVAMDRGTPLADVLSAQAADAREASRRALIEAGGRKEIAMMVPVVFLVLPLSVLFVLFPGFYGLSLGS